MSAKKNNSTAVSKKSKNINKRSKYVSQLSSLRKTKCVSKTTLKRIYKKKNFKRFILQNYTIFT